MASNFGFAPSKKKGAYFISYNTEDAERIAPIVFDLHKSGLDIWYDGGLKHGGNKWDNQIAGKMMDCTAVIMFITEGIFKKPESYVKTEYEMAVDIYDKRIFVVMMDTIDRKVFRTEIGLNYAPWYTQLKQHHLVIDATAKGIRKAIFEDLRDEDMSPADLCEKGVEYFKKGKYDLAVTYYKLAIKNDNEFSYTKAQFCLAMCYYKGNGVDKNDQEAYRLFKQAADNGNVNAMSYLGLFFLNGLVVKANPKKAVEYFKKAAEGHIKWAQFNLAKCYENGVGTDKDINLAIKYYQMADEHNHPQAKAALARLKK